MSYPTAGMGNVGTNGTLDLHGASTHVDGLTLYDWQNNPDAARCTGQGCPAASATTTVNAPLDTSQAVGLDRASSRPRSTPARLAGPLTAFVGASIAPKPDGSPYCFSSFHADSQNFEVTGSPTDPPVRIFVDGGDVTLGNKNHSDVNNDVATAAQLDPAADLQHRHDGAACTTRATSPRRSTPRTPPAVGVTSNAGSDFYGSMICKTIDNVGGWTFHYDTRLASIGDGTWRIREYTER